MQAKWTFDTEEEAKEACDLLNNNSNVSIIPVAVDEDVLLSFSHYSHPKTILINYKNIKDILYKEFSKGGN